MHERSRSWAGIARRRVSMRCARTIRRRRTNSEFLEPTGWRSAVSSFLPVVPRGQQILTTGCSGGWKSGQFCWPLWNVDLTRMTARSVLQTPGLAELPERVRRARGISAVFAFGHPPERSSAGTEASLRQWPFEPARRHGGARPPLLVVGDRRGRMDLPLTYELVFPKLARGPIKAPAAPMAWGSF